MEVLQTSALPLGYGAEVREASAQQGDVVGLPEHDRAALAGSDIWAHYR